VLWQQQTGPDGTPLPTGATTAIGRVTVAYGTGVQSDENFNYVMMATPPSRFNFPPSYDYGTFMGLWRSTDALQSFVKVTMRMNLPVIGSPGVHNWADINLYGQDAANAGALVVDPADAYVVYVGGSQRNLTNPVLSQLPVRQAISLAIDRNILIRWGRVMGRMFLRADFRARLAGRPLVIQIVQVQLFPSRTGLPERFSFYGPGPHLDRLLDASPVVRSETNPGLCGAGSCPGNSWAAP
jgi:hypothetical protein